MYSKQVKELFLPKIVNKTNKLVIKQKDDPKMKALGHK